MQKLMLQARSSVRRSSLKEPLYPPLGAEPDTAHDDGTTNRPEPANALWPELNKNHLTIENQLPEETESLSGIRPQEVIEAPIAPAEDNRVKEVALQREPFAEKAIFPVGNVSNGSSAEIKPLTEKDLFPGNDILSGSNMGKRPLAEEDTFLENNPVAETKPLTEKDLFPDSTPVTAPLRQPEKRTVVNVILPKENTQAPVAPLHVRHVEEAVNRKDALEETTAYRGGQTTEPEEERPVVYRTAKTGKKQNRTKAFSYALILAAALLAGFGGYYFYLQHQPQNPVIAKRNTAIIPAPVETEATAPADPVTVGNETETDLQPVEATGTKNQEANAEEIQDKSAAKQPVSADESPASTGNSATSDAEQYKVISKAYFHDEPDESTRRKAFIIHWNNAVLTPQQEKNGFVYVVFTNHLGQISKGWLRKKDLQKLN